MMKTRKKSGFSLLELMIAGVVLALGLLTSITVTLNAAALERTNTDRDTAKDAAKLQMQGLKGRGLVTLLEWIDGTQTPPAGWTADGTTVQGPFEVYGLKEQTGDTDGCGWVQITKRAGAVNDNLLDLTVRVEWETNGRDMAYELNSMKSDRGKRWETSQ